MEDMTREQKYAEAIWPGEWLPGDLSLPEITAVMAVADAEQDQLRAEVERLRAGWRKVTSALGYGDGVTEPQISHDNFLELMQEQARDADEWREHELWRGDCYAAGHPDTEDCYEHDPVLRRSVAEAKVARVEALVDHWATDPHALMGIRNVGEVVARDVRAALADPS